MTVNIRKRRSYKPLAENKAADGRCLYALLTLIAAAGTFAGAYSYGGADINTDADFTSAFLKSLCSAGIYILAFFLGGLSAAGQPVGYALCLFKGLGAGYLAAFAMKSGSVGTVLNVLPFEAVSMAAVILGARENIRMSSLISKRAFGAPYAASDEGTLRLYFAKFALIMLTGIAAAAADGLMAAIF